MTLHSFVGRAFSFLHDLRLRARCKRYDLQDRFYVWRARARPAIYILGAVAVFAAYMAYKVLR